MPNSDAEVSKILEEAQTTNKMDTELSLNINKSTSNNELESNYGIKNINVEVESVATTSAQVF